MGKSYLLVNDDGPSVSTLYLAAKLISKGNDVLVVVPNENKSAFAGKLTIKGSMLLESLTKQVTILCKRTGLSEADETAEIAVPYYAVHGSPCDAAIVGLTIAKQQGVIIDLVISGPNAGSNIGLEVMYSGTFNAARSARLEGTKSVAFSVDNFELNALPITDIDWYAEQVIKTVETHILHNYDEVEKEGDASHNEFVFYNVNFPALGNVFKDGFQTIDASVGRRRYVNYATFKQDPITEQTRFEIVGEMIPTADEYKHSTIDCVLLEYGHGSVTKHRADSF